MKNAVLMGGLLLASACSSHAFSFKCLGSSSCVVTQGTRMTFDDSLSLLDLCEDFTRGNAGARVMTLSMSEILKIGGGNLNHPITAASYAYDELVDSPLAFDRREPHTYTKYQSIRRACGNLHQDVQNYLRRSR